MNAVNERLSWHAMFETGMVPILLTASKGVLEKYTWIAEIKSCLAHGNTPTSKLFQSYKKNRLSELFRLSKRAEQLFEYYLWRSNLII